MEDYKSKSLSVIIPVYDSSDYLLKCIESVLNQTYSQLEIICVDDGSTDKSGEICDQFAKRDSRVTVVHQNNHGESYSRNVGLKMAKGDYITFVDCDDYLELDMYEKMMEKFQSNDTDIVACGYSMDFEDRIVCMENKLPVPEEVMGRDSFLEYVYHRDIYKNVTGYIWNKIYKREVLLSKGNEVRFDENLKLGGDVLFFANAALNAKGFVYLNRCFYHYIQRGNSGSHSEDENYRMDGLIAYQKTVDACESGGVSSLVVGYVKRFLVFWAQVNARYAYEHGNKKVLESCQAIMAKYKDVYIKLNDGFDDRIEQFLEIENYKL